MAISDSGLLRNLYSVLLELDQKEEYVFMFDLRYLIKKQEKREREKLCILCRVLGKEKR